MYQSNVWKAEILGKLKIKPSTQILDNPHLVTALFIERAVQLSVRAGRAGLHKYTHGILACGYMGAVRV